MQLLGPSDVAMMQFDAASVIASFGQAVIWLRRITEHTPGAVPAPDFDTARGQLLTSTGESMNSGWQLTVGARTYHGYQPTLITAAIAEDTSLTKQLLEGWTHYESPIAITTAKLAKGDVLVLGPRRFIVGDSDVLDILQGFSVLLWYVVPIEGCELGHPVYSLAVS